MSCSFNNCNLLANDWQPDKIGLCREHRAELTWYHNRYKYWQEKQARLSRSVYVNYFDKNECLNTYIEMREATMNEIKGRLEVFIKLAPEFRNQGHRKRIQILFNTVHQIDLNIDYLQKSF